MIWRSPNAPKSRTRTADQHAFSRSGGLSIRLILQIRLYLSSVRHVTTFTEGSMVISREKCYLCMSITAILLIHTPNPPLAQIRRGRLEEIRNAGPGTRRSQSAIIHVPRRCFSIDHHWCTRCSWVLHCCTQDDAQDLAAECYQRRAADSVPPPLSLHPSRYRSRGRQLVPQQSLPGRICCGLGSWIQFERGRKGGCQTLSDRDGKNVVSLLLMARR